MPEKPNIEEKPTSVLSPTLSRDILIAQVDEGSIPLGDPLTFLPMAGGVHTDKETALLRTGEFSSLINLRPKHPGFQTRKGQLQHHTTADGTNKVLSLFQFQKSKIDEGYFLAQMSDGDILQATDMPPDTTTGAFGSEVHDGGADQIPASWSNIKDRLIHSNGVDQHQVFTGDNNYVDRFIIYDGIDSVHIPTKGVDYTKEVSDGLTTTHADLGALKPGTLTDVGSALSPTACCTDPDNDVDVVGDWEIYPPGVTLESISGGVTGNRLKVENSGVTSLEFAAAPNMALEEGKFYRLLAKTSATSEASYTVYIQHETVAANTPYTSGWVDGEGDGVWHTFDEVFECTRTGNYKIMVTTASTSYTIWLDNVSVFEIQFQCVFLFSPVQANGITWTLPNVNVNASVSTIKYHKSDGTWADCSITDNTAVGGVTLAGTGQSMTWTPPSDEITSFMYGRCGFWYQLTVSAELSATVHATKVTYSSQFQDIRNIWDGVPVAPVEVMVEGESDWSVYAAGAVSLDSLTAGYKIRISSVDRIEGVLVNPGAAPNTTDAEIDTFKYWDGDSWTTVGTVVDSSDGVKSAGWITFPRQDAQLRQFGSSGFYTYWYEITLTKDLSTCVVLALSTMPYFDIEDYGRGYVNCAWKNRMVYSFGDKYIYISKNHEPGVLNGDDFDARQVGDGRENKVVAMRQFYNELAVWQEEKGVGGGTFSLYEGNSKPTWAFTMLSSKLGTFSSKSVVVVESSATSGTMKILLFWISRRGVCMSDGSGAIVISWDIQNYFDPSKSECIRRGYEKEMWIAHDSKDEVLLLGLVSGDSATTPNIFPVYDLRSGEWSFDERGQALACVVEIESGSGGDTPIVQMGGGVADGTIHKLNHGQHDNGTTITSSETIEIDANGGMLQLKEMLLRIKAQT